MINDTVIAVIMVRAVRSHSKVAFADDLTVYSSQTVGHFLNKLHGERHN